MYKQRGEALVEDNELKRRLQEKRKLGVFKEHSIDIEDLQDLKILEQRKKIGKGELSSIVFAKKTRQAFLTDDRKAANLAKQVIDPRMVQSTPHILAALFFVRALGDADKDVLIIQHESLNGDLALKYEEAYSEACRCRLMSQGTMAGTDKS